MAIKLRFIMLGCVLLLLSGCVRTFGSIEPQEKPVAEKAVVIPVQYLEGQKVGPVYNVSVTLPDDWVGQFVTSSEGNMIYFNYDAKNGVKAPIFSITALSPLQYWKQMGSYAGSYHGLQSRDNTFFVYSQLSTNYYSGIDKAKYDALAKQVPDIVSTFNAQLSQ